MRYDNPGRRKTMPFLLSVYAVAVGILAAVSVRLAAVAGGGAFAASAVVHAALLGWCYVGCVFLDPGVFARSGRGDEVAADDGGRYCRECKVHTPWGVTHCHDCCVCVVRMDHHCAVVGCCVGDGNLEHFEGCVYFAQTLSYHVYLAVACWFAATFAEDPEPALGVVLAVGAAAGFCAVACAAPLPLRRLGLARGKRHRLDRGSSPESPAKRLVALPRTKVCGPCSLPRSLTADDVAAIRAEFLEARPSLFRDEPAPPPVAVPMPAPPTSPPPEATTRLLGLPVGGGGGGGDVSGLPAAAPAAPAPGAAAPPRTYATPAFTGGLFRSDAADDDGATVASPESPQYTVVRDAASGRLSSRL